MKRKLIITEDGSHTLYVPELNEHYHSIHGAIQESGHIFIQAGLAHVQQKNVSVLEAGFGTGLNALLSLIYAHTHHIRVEYVSFEKYPLSVKEAAQLNYFTHLPEEFRSFFDKMHCSDWETTVALSPFFAFRKYRAGFDQVNFDSLFDVVYFDAFNPEVQPELWSEEILGKFVKSLKTGGILTTYCVKGIVKEVLRHLNCKIERLPGPPGKRQMLRAQKLTDHG